MSCLLGYELSELKQDQDTPSKYVNVVPTANGYIGGCVGQAALKMLDALWGVWSPQVHLLGPYTGGQDVGAWDFPSRIFIKIPPPYWVYQQFQQATYEARWIKKSGVYYIKWYIGTDFEVEEYIFTPRGKKAIVDYVILKNVSGVLKNPMKIQFLADLFLDSDSEGVNISRDAVNGVLIAKHTVAPEAHYVFGLSTEDIGDWQCGIAGKAEPPDQSAYTALVANTENLPQDGDVTSGVGEVANLAISTSAQSIASGATHRTAIIIAIGDSDADALVNFNAVASLDIEDLIDTEVTWWRSWLDEGLTPAFEESTWNEWVNHALINMKMHMTDDHGIIADWAAYPQVFPRDAFPAAWSFAVWGHQTEAKGICTWMKAAYEATGWKNQYKVDKTDGGSTANQMDNYPRYIYAPFKVYRQAINGTFLRSYWDMVDATVTQMISLLTEDNLVAYPAGNKDDIYAYLGAKEPTVGSYVLEHQVNYYFAFKYGALLAKSLGYTTKQAAWNVKAEAMRVAIITLLRTASRYGYYYDPGIPALDETLTLACEQLMCQEPFNDLDSYVENSLVAMKGAEYIAGAFMPRWAGETIQFTPYLGRYMTNKKMNSDTTDFASMMDLIIQKFSLMGQLAQDYSGTDEGGDPLVVSGCRLLIWGNAEILIALKTVEASYSPGPLSATISQKGRTAVIT